MKPMAIPSSVLILGLGETGLASALWCLRQGLTITVADTREQPPGLEQLQQVQPQLCTILGDACYHDETLDQIDTIVLSPGLSSNAEPTASFLSKARAQGIEIIGEIELFARALDQLAQTMDYRPQVLAVTGTNGKTTVTSMVEKMVQTASKTAKAAGNISPSALTALMQCLDQNTLPQVWVLELSSFQMATTEHLRPAASVVLNVTQDHLDWHKDMQDYAQHKAKLLQLSQIKVINRDDPLVTTMVEHKDDLDVCSFGESEIVLSGDLGINSQEGLSWLCVADADEQFDLPPNSNSRKKQSAVRVVRKAGRTKLLMPVDALKVRGQHNALNALAALGLCRAINLPWAPLLNALQNYQPAPHRVNFVRSIRDVDFIDDSKGTNVGATVAAIKGMGHKLVLIAGGLGKGQDFSPLLEPIAKNARAVLLIGRDAHIIHDQLKSAGVPLIFCDSLESAVKQSLQYAQAHDAVLLSPACSSMDMFTGYAHRAEVFVAAVHELALEMGEIA